MGVFSRLTDIINSNLNSMLDKAEDPEKIVRLIVQEMEDTLVEVRSRAAAAIADKKEVERKRNEFLQRANEWESKAELAIAKGRDDLAKGAIGAKRKATEMVELLDAELKALDESLDKANLDLTQLQAKLKEAKAKKRSMELRRETASTSVRVKRQIHDGRIDEALARYDAYERKIDELEAEAESISMGRPKSLEQEFAELESQDAVDEELNALKQRVAARAGGTGGQAS
ncbi:MAG: phage shock protein PspA [Pseudomonadota bacterium]